MVTFAKKKPPHGSVSKVIHSMQHSCSQLCNPGSFLCFANVNIVDGRLHKSEKAAQGKTV